MPSNPQVQEEPSQHPRLTESWQIPALLLPTPPLHSKRELLRGGETFVQVLTGHSLTFPTWPQRVWLLEAPLWHLRGVQGSSSRGP